MMTLKFSGIAALLLASAGSAPAQVELYAVDFPGNLFTVNPATGAATLVAHTGFDRLNASAADAGGVIFAARARNASISTDENRLVRIDRATGVGTLIASYGVENDLRGLAFLGNVLYGIRDASTGDELVTVDPATGAVTLVGGTGRGDIQGLTATGSGELFAVGVSGGGIGGGLYQIDVATGLATVISPGMGAGSDVQTIEWIDGADAWIARASLRTVNLTTGVQGLVGPLGVPDVRGLAAVREAACYADCDGDGALTLADFGCFQTKFALGDLYADCNGDSLLNLADFGCFQTQFALGCP